jgi:hypothetical protein
MSVIKVTSKTFLIKPVDFSYSALDDEILVEKSFSKIAGNIDKALVMPLTEKTTSIRYLPLVDVVVSKDIKEGCVLPKSWIESVEEYTINEYGMLTIQKRENLISDHLSRMFRTANAIVLKTELNFLNDQAEVYKQNRFYESLLETMNERYKIL